MVDEQLVRRNILDAAVLTAMRTVPRHLFVPNELQDKAYDDRALGLGPTQHCLLSSDRVDFPGDHRAFCSERELLWGP